MVFPMNPSRLASLLLVAGSVLVLGVGEVSAPMVKCATCGAPITSVYYKIPGLSEFYCEKCYQTLPHCFFCGRPMREAKVGPRMVCPACRHEVIEDPAQAQRLVLEVREWISAHLHLQFPEPIGFQFVEDLAPHVGVQLLGTTRELGAFIREGEKVRILLITGMPRPLLMETAAHELAHVWQNGRIPPHQRLLVKEGFAQWVAAKVLEAFQCDQALRVLREREDLYGQGYQTIQSVEDRRGVSGVLEFAKRSQ